MCVMGFAHILVWLLRKEKNRIEKKMEVWVLSWSFSFFLHLFFILIMQILGCFFFGWQKIVLKLELHDDKTKQKAMKNVCSHLGIEFFELFAPSVWLMREPKKWQKF